MSSLVLLPASFAILLAGALLFTNGIEWFGSKLGVGIGAVGSILAAVATALPESLIPVVAIIDGGAGSTDVAIGAILGAPLLLATAAMVLAGVAALVYHARRSPTIADTAHFPTLRRDLGFFLVCLSFGLLLGLGAPRPIRVAGAVLLVIAYVTYARRTLRNGGSVEAAKDLRPLMLDSTRGDPPHMSTVALQLLVALGAIVGGAEIFVQQVLHLAGSMGFEPLVLSLVLAPFATELPEKANSFFWVRDGKDSLALGNITGALVFQSTFPVAIGLAFTDWALGEYAMLAGCLALAGGLVAVVAFQVRRRFSGRAIFAWTVLYALFVGYVVVTS